MRSRLAITSALLFALLVPAHAQSASVSDYRRQLQDISQKIDSLKLHPEQAGQVVTGIPDQVSVTTSSGEIKVNYKSLKDDLAAYSPAEADKRDALLARIQNYVQSLTVAAEAFDNAPVDISSARGKLDQILARREFNRVKGPSAKDTLLARIYRWLSRILSKIFSRKG